MAIRFSSGVPVARIVATRRRRARSVRAQIKFREISATGGHEILSLYGAQHSARHQILLHKGCDAEDRHGGQHDANVANL